jgi:hypothetical protein
MCVWWDETQEVYGVKSNYTGNQLRVGYCNKYQHHAYDDSGCGNVLKEPESLAMLLHEAGRMAVKQGATVAAEKFGEPSRTFIEWNDLGPAAREGRIMQAKYLLGKLTMIVHPGAALWDVEKEK